MSFLNVLKFLWKMWKNKCRVVRFLKRFVSNGHQGYIYLMKNTVDCKIVI